MRIRAATPADAEEIAGVHISAWRGAYAGILPDAVLANLSQEHRAEQWAVVLREPASSVLVLDDGTRLRGVAYLKPVPDDDALDHGELDSLNLHPDVWRQGWGRRLFAAALEVAHQRGFGLLTLWVYADNHRARRFYEAMGLTHDGTSEPHPRFGVLVLRYRGTVAGALARAGTPRTAS